MMALSPFFCRDQSTFHPFGRSAEPFQRLALWNNKDVARSRRFAQNVSAISSSTLVDWNDTPEALVFKAEFPGLRKEDVKVQVEDGRMLKIRHQTKKEQEEKRDEWHRVERSKGSFLWCFRLSENANLEDLNAKMEDSVLTVTVPKVEEPKSDVNIVDVPIS